eukprot:SAG31_NODE_28830_length_404_cov_1.498361_1_plen_92_part_10
MVDPVRLLDDGHNNELSWNRAVANAEIDDRLLVAYLHEGKPEDMDTIEDLSSLGDEYRHVHVLEVDVNAAPAIAQQVGLSDGMTPTLVVKKP